MSEYSQIDINTIINIAKEAGKAILKIYNSDDFGTEYKKDESPLTKADLASNKIIIDGLSKYYPGIPIVSEEHPESENLRAMESNLVFVVDPLDGTKEFVKRNGQFTVNIGLLLNKRPIAGVVFAPYLDDLYYASDGMAYKNDQLISVSKSKEVTTAVASKSHYDETTTKFLKQFGDIELTQAGSSIKFCLIAEGKAEIYPRFHPCMEWDTAAADAILSAAGGAIHNTDGDLLKYGKDKLFNESFIASNNFVEFNK